MILINFPHHPHPQLLPRDVRRPDRFAENSRFSELGSQRAPPLCRNLEGQPRNQNPVSRIRWILRTLRTDAGVPRVRTPSFLRHLISYSINVHVKKKLAVFGLQNSTDSFLSVCETHLGPCTWKVISYSKARTEIKRKVLQQ